MAGKVKGLSQSGSRFTSASLVNMLRSGMAGAENLCQAVRNPEIG